jgi:hypothetical protein
MFRRLSVFALLLLASSLLADEWQFIGPKDFGARVISLAVDPKNADHVFAGSASGGLWERRSAKIRGATSTPASPSSASVPSPSIRTIRTCIEGETKVAR